ncbi:MAG: universal stress protein [Limisphaerales bacterium]
MSESSEKELAALARAVIGGQVPAQALVRTGRPVQEIVEAAKQLEIDLIINSTHGRTGWKHVFLGSTTESVVRAAPCPVLTVREQEHEFV